jgi:outer membrane protein assembly factor BamB
MNTIAFVAVAGLSTVIAATAIAAVPVSSASPDLAATPVGWRTDGTGRYPGAKPPTVWSAEENVAWKVKLPGKSNGSPIVVGERIFVVSDPAEVLCLNAADGEIVWRRSCGLAELYGAEKAAEITAETKRLREEKGKLERELGTVKDDLEKQGPLKAQIAERQKGLDELAKQFATPPELANGETTNSAPTPVSDGVRVYALFGNGVACAYTPAGEPVWVKYLEWPSIGFGGTSSPLVCDGKLIVHLNDLMALDCATGEIVWRTALAARHASPLAAEVDGKKVIVSPGGAIVRAEDGKVLLNDGQLSSSECSSIVQEGVLYRVTDGRAAAFRLVAAGENIKLERLWEEKISSGRRTPSPVWHDGLLYTANTDGILDVVDAASGKQVYRQRLNIGSLYSSAAFAGGSLYFSGTKGTTLVVAPGREFEERARNELEPLGSNFVFAGGRIFVRTKANLFCIGR